MELFLASFFNPLNDLLKQHSGIMNCTCYPDHVENSRKQKLILLKQLTIKVTRDGPKVTLLTFNVYSIFVSVSFLIIFFLDLIIQLQPWQLC